MVEKGKIYTVRGISKKVINIYKKGNTIKVDLSYDNIDESITLDKFEKWINPTDKSKVIKHWY